MRVPGWDPILSDRFAGMLDVYVAATFMVRSRAVCRFVRYVQTHFSAFEYQLGLAPDRGWRLHHDQSWQPRAVGFLIPSRAVTPWGTRRALSQGTLNPGYELKPPLP